jgi:RecA/RadA recombinase
VHDVERAAVRGLERVGVLERVEDLDAEVHRHLPRQLPRAAVGERPLALDERRPAPEVEAVHVVHHEEVAAVLAAEVRDRDDAGVPQHRHDAGFALEHLHGARVGVVAQHALDHDGADEVGRAFAARQVDHAHAATGERAHDAVAAEHHSADEIVLFVDRGAHGETCLR